MMTQSEGTSVLAVVAGQPFTEVPADLFIPPDALEVLLDSFSGPLDLLLYLIRRQNLDILDIPISLITQQYMQYIALMEKQRLELAAEYLVMAAVLAEIKSRMLLPPTVNPEEDVEDDPRMQLVRKLQAYEQIKHAAMALDELPRCERDIFTFALFSDRLEKTILHPDVDLGILTEAMRDVLKRQSHLSHHQISREPLSVRERMSNILDRLYLENFIPFEQLFNPSEGRMGLAVTLLAILELARQSLISITQVQPFKAIHLQAVQDG
ncbi:segregation and condensation protein A [Legionella jordanis]|uniref:Segregation and condensation protein A n=1 Tax=Legionella jordanis TaxID=456 RepID=A0A0W0VAA8_9GAMM|nr:segregation/condensation protein A [Legionella jordanis]KTD17095.1 segregation and condensation protein A [Legionella jordanis]RMX03227.1 segregation/condensation protein A [Legionella jordanis]RMX18205.1 segregation/condensation protein A [Legionella jordanis]VEH12708.1 segregation and condensation protein A [Legionella jordanis]HAT8713143.1 segregation/condensation protein A [Legionella jordanis]